MPTTLLAIETSCDETGVAILRRTDKQVELLGQAIASQIDIHKETGGVVPDVAAREHVTALPVLLEKVVVEARITNRESHIDAIAVTQGPGLAPALAVGVTTAQALALAWQKPIIPVHHLEGHIYSALLQSAERIPNPIPQIPNKFKIADDQAIFPTLALIVSGGHTQLVWMSRHLAYEIIGSTRDDAAGEAFDKVARLLGLPYPGGPHLSRLAEQGNPAAFAFTRPMLRSNDLDFSFSGLKTEVLYTVRDLPPDSLEQQKADIAASFEQAVIDTLAAKTDAALQRRQPTLLLAAGGVIANKKLRAALQRVAKKRVVPLQIAPLALCGDNAVMIGQAAFFANSAGRLAAWQDLDIRPRWDMA
ncbi:MAG: tRNA (adenosine(37)-N6)-threonylcarbamoyltransferase complex transferase subunit TsaD, partial [Candidatus Andersenbacteria bacterium CG10_big_fil_rev_8_21_14_0_10_54_11]